MNAEANFERCRHCQAPIFGDADHSCAGSARQFRDEQAAVVRELAELVVQQTLILSVLAEKTDEEKVARGIWRDAVTLARRAERLIR